MALPDYEEKYIDKHPLDVCEMSVRLENVLHCADIKYIEDAITKLKDGSLFEIRNFGKKTKMELEYLIDKYTSKRKSNYGEDTSNYPFRPLCMMDLFNTLEEREKQILLKYLGRDNEFPGGYSHIAKEYNLSSQRLSQIVHKAKEKFKQPSRVLFCAFLPDYMLTYFYDTTDVKYILYKYIFSKQIVKIRRVGSNGN